MSDLDGHLLRNNAWRVVMLEANPYAAMPLACVTLWSTSCGPLTYEYI